LRPGDAEQVPLRGIARCAQEQRARAAPRSDVRGSGGAVTVSGPIDGHLQLLIPIPFNGAGRTGTARVVAIVFSPEPLPELHRGILPQPRNRSYLEDTAWRCARYQI